MRQSRIALTSSLVAFAAATPAFAQTAQPSAAPRPATAAFSLAPASADGARMGSDIASRAAVIDLDEVVISATRTATSRLRTGVAVTALGRDTLAKDARTSLAETLAQQPGVALVQNGPFGNRGDIFIRGVGAGYVSVRIDGIRIDDPATIQGGLDSGSLLASDVGRVEILRGSQSALWGGSAVGGVVSITSRRPEVEGTEQSLELEAGSYSTTRLTYGLTQKTGPLELALTATHLNTDGFSTAKIGTEKDGAEAKRLSFSARYQLSDAIAVGGAYFVQHTAQQYDDSYSGPDYILVDSDARQARLERGARLYAEFAGGQTDHILDVTYYDIGRGFTDRLDASPYLGKRLTASWQASYQPSETFGLVYGLDWMQERASSPFIASGEVAQYVAGAFATGTWSPNDALDLSLALRLDQHSAFGSYPTGRVAAAWHLSEQTTLRSAIARGYRAPTLDQRFADYIDPDWADYYSNPDLEPEQSWSYEIGVEHEFGSGATVSASVYRLELDNFVRAQPIDPTNIWGDQRYVNVAGKTVFQGVEMAAHLPLNDKTQLGFGYALTKSDNIVGVPEHRLTASLDTALSARLSAGLRAVHVADLRANRTQMLEDYTVLDAQFGYTLTDATEVYLRIENLADHQYETVKDYGTSDRAIYVGLRSKF